MTATDIKPPSPCADAPTSEPAAADPSTTQARSDAYRRRLLDGLMTSIEHRGLTNSTVADVVRHARTSRRTFYEHFTDRSDCFQALVQRYGQRTWQSVLDTVDDGAPAAEQIRTVVTVLCGAFAEHAALTVSAIRELAPLGPPARELQRSLRDTLAKKLVSISDGAGSGDDSRTAQQRMLLARVAVGGLLEVVVVTVDEGGDVRAHADEIADAMLRVLEVPA